MNVDLHFGEHRRFTLKQAILLYEQDGSAHAACATVHPVHTTGPRPVIGPGQPVTIAGIQSLVQSLGGEFGSQFLPAHVLCLGIGRLAWWTPASRHRIWFQPHDDDPQFKALKAVNGRFVHHPPLLFLASQRGIKVFALPRNERPAPETRVYRAPYYNLGNDGYLCEGSARLPESPTPANLTGYEQGFFRSAFTHSNVHGEKLVRHAGGHAGFWTELAERRKAPDAAWWRQHLIPRSILGPLLKRDRDQ